MKSLLVLALFGCSLSLHPRAAERDLLETLRPAARQAISEFSRIDADRKEKLKQGAEFIRARMSERKSADIIFICTHNSRRSHLSQLWAEAAAVCYGITNVSTYSGGTEVAACNIRTVNALRRAGFSIVQATAGNNPVYLAQVGDSLAPAKLYSKRFTAPENPQTGFLAVFTCDKAAAACPVVPEAALRVPVLYVDPKASDDTPEEEATYDERSRQIAREMFYMMSLVSKSH